MPFLKCNKKPLALWKQLTFNIQGTIESYYGGSWAAHYGKDHLVWQLFGENCTFLPKAITLIKSLRRFSTHQHNKIYPWLPQRFRKYKKYQDRIFFPAAAFKINFFLNSGDSTVIPMILSFISKTIYTPALLLSGRKNKCKYWLWNLN